MQEITFLNIVFLCAFVSQTMTPKTIMQWKVFPLFGEIVLPKSFFIPMTHRYKERF